MKFVYLIFLLSITSLSSAHDMGSMRLYEISDMDDLLRDYYTNDLKRISPGLVCGDFSATNSVGCFKLLVGIEHGKVEKLIYVDLASNKISNIYTFSPPVNYIYIEKIFQQRLKSPTSIDEGDDVILKEGQASLRLIFFEKSSLVFYWRNNKFEKIWTSD